MKHHRLYTAIIVLTCCLLLHSPFREVAVANHIAKTYYVDAAIGDDTRSELQARDPNTPWKTIKKGMGVVIAGDTLIVLAGTYNESVESKRDGSEEALITIQASGTVLIQPPPGTPAGTSGFFVSHNHIIIDGFTASGWTIGLRLGAHDGGDGPVAGIVVRNNTATGNSNNGIQFKNAVSCVAEFNTASNNGLNGIVYSGNSSQIHDNVANSNGQFGIYVKDGVDHQVWNNTATGNVGANLKILGATIPPPGTSLPPGQRTFYIDPVAGNDTREDWQSQNPLTPWRTVKRGLQTAIAGETVLLQPGLYAESVESFRDGTADAPITIKAKVPGTATIQPPAGTVGFYIGHNYHLVDGVVVVGGVTALQMGPYKNTNGTVIGSFIRNTTVNNAVGIGIKFTNAVDGTVMHSTVSASGREGIYYSGTGATLFNNLVVKNGRTLASAYGVTLVNGNRHQIINNTIYGNLNGGLRLGTSNNVPVFSTVLNNIIVKSPIGVREPSGSDYTGRATLDYNIVYGNASNYELSNAKLTLPGPHSIMASPIFVDAVRGDFRLGRIDTGQIADSPAINAGSDTAENLGLAGRTTFTDKFPDVETIDLGYHPTLLYVTEGITTISQATLTFDQAGQSFTFAANLKAGPGNDGIETGTEFVQVSFGGSAPYFLPAANFVRSGSTWVYNGGNVAAASLEELPDGSVNVTLQVTGLAFQATISTSMGIALQIGDDFGSALVNFRGTLQSP
ncbi:MAG: right-handed parallel beta-helix repeat-containing protein [Deltaproteobacteria bacterium]|nr:right-handed parallel beta-helix repeat-containing protein [Deltaproteobacteria bacterium]